MSDDVEELAAALRSGLAGGSAPELADALFRKLGDALADDETTPAEVIVTAAPLFIWRMSVERAPTGLIESVVLAPIARAEPPR